MLQEGLHFGKFFSTTFHCLDLQNSDHKKKCTCSAVKISSRRIPCGIWVYKEAIWTHLGKINAHIAVDECFDSLQEVHQCKLSIQQYQ